MNSTRALTSVALVTSLAAGASLWLLTGSFSMYGYPPLTVFVEYNTGYLAAFLLATGSGLYTSTKLLIKNTLKPVAVLNLLWLSLCFSILTVVVFRFSSTYWRYFNG